MCNLKFQISLLLSRTTCRIVLLRVISLELPCYLNGFVGCVDILLSGWLTLFHESQEGCLLYPLSWSKDPRHLALGVISGSNEVTEETVFLAWHTAHEVLSKSSLLFSLLLLFWFTAWVIPREDAFSGLFMWQGSRKKESLSFSSGFSLTSPCFPSWFNLSSANIYHF